MMLCCFVLFCDEMYSTNSVEKIEIVVVIK